MGRIQRPSSVVGVNPFVAAQLGVVACWPLNGYPHDIMRGRPSTINGAFGGGYQSGSAYDCTGTHWVDAGTYDLVGNSGPWSASAWVYPTTSADYTIIAKRDAANTTNQFRLGTGDSARRVSIGTGAAFANFSTLVLNLNAWNHVCVGASSAGAVAMLNGVVATSGSNWASGSASTGSRIGIGRLITEGINNMTGLVSDVWVMNRALSRAELWTLYDPRSRWNLYADAEAA